MLPATPVDAPPVSFPGQYEQLVAADFASAVSSGEMSQKAAGTEVYRLEVDQQQQGAANELSTVEECEVANRSRSRYSPASGIVFSFSGHSGGLCLNCCAWEEGAGGSLKPVVKIHTWLVTSCARDRAVRELNQSGLQITIKMQPGWPHSTCESNRRV